MSDGTMQQSVAPRTEAASWLSLEGRLPRSTYWLYFVLPLTVLGFLAAGVDALMGADPTNAIAEAIRATFGETYLSLGAFAGPVSNVVTLFILWPFTVGTVKRLHDLDLSGWVWTGYTVIGSVGWGVFLMSPGSGVGTALAVLAGLCGLAFGIYVYFMPGTSGQNRYGPDPLGSAESGSA